jgi:integrase
MGKVLTARAVEAARPKRDTAGKLVRNEIPDGTGLGLFLQVEPTGTKAWTRRFRQSGVSKKVTLGKAGDGGLSLAAARAAAAKHFLQVEQGIVTVPAAPAVIDPARGDIVEVAIASFLELHARRKNRTATAWAAERIFNRLVLPAWRGRSIHDIKRRDVIDLVESIAADRPYLANRTVAVLSKLFNWLMARDVLAASPVAGVERPHKEKARTHTLTDPELRALWLACEDGDPFTQAIKLMVLSGTRRNEAAHLKYVEIDEPRRLWVLPATRSKNGREHLIPLSSQAWALIQAQPRIAGCPYVFSADGRGPVVGFAKAKTRISAKAGLEESSWRLHDLRRTCAAGLQRLGISVSVIEKALNHQSGVFRGIVSTYQTHDYAEEIRVALQRWSNYVEELAADRPSQTVVPMRRRRRE